MFVNETIKTEQYSIFLVVLHYLLNFVGKNIKDKDIFLQDNATIHLLLVETIPPYPPRRGDSFDEL